MNQSHTNALQHVLGALSVLGTVLGPVFSVLPAPYGAIGAAIAGSLAYLVGALGKALLPPAAPSVGTSSTLKVLVFLVPALGVALLLSGCAWLSSQAGVTVELAAVDSAIAVAESKGVSAATINSLARLGLTGDTVASGILAGVLTKSNPSLTEAEAELAAALQEAIAKTGG
jgi:hypothetical protein